MKNVSLNAEFNSATNSVTIDGVNFTINLDKVENNTLQNLKDEEVKKYEKELNKQFSDVDKETRSNPFKMMRLAKQYNEEHRFTEVLDVEFFLSKLENEPLRKSNRILDIVGYMNGTTVLDYGFEGTFSFNNIKEGLIKRTILAQRNILEHVQIEIEKRNIYALEISKFFKAMKEASEGEANHKIKVAEYQSKLTDFETELNTLKATNNDKEAQKEEVLERQNFENVTGKISEVEALIATSKEALKLLTEKEEIEGAKVEISNLQTRLHELKTQHKASKKKLDKLAKVNKETEAQREQREIERAVKIAELETEISKLVEEGTPTFEGKSAKAIQSDMLLYIIEKFELRNNDSAHKAFNKGHFLALVRLLSNELEVKKFKATKEALIEYIFTDSVLNGTKVVKVTNAQSMFIDYLLEDRDGKNPKQESKERIAFRNFVKVEGSMSGEEVQAVEQFFNPVTPPQTKDETPQHTEAERLNIQIQGCNRMEEGPAKEALKERISRSMDKLKEKQAEELVS